MMSQRPRLIFRADGNAQLGLGHLMRCLALAEMLGEAFDRQFAIIDPDTALTSILTDKGIPVRALSTNEVQEFCGHIRPGDVVVLDGYSFDEGYQRTLKRRATLVVIDDFCTGYQVADVVINHTAGITEYAYQAEAYTQFFLGPHYALLRPAFFQLFGPTPDEGPIFVSLGGADPNNVSLRVLEGLHAAFLLQHQPVPVRLVLGLFHPDRAAIEAFVSIMPTLTFVSNLTGDQMADELKQCRLAITACSTVAYEVCAAGRPLIAIQTADNQTRLAQSLAKPAMATRVFQSPDYLERLPEAIVLALNNTMAFPTDRRRYYFDKCTPDRFRQIFARLCSATA